MKPSSGWAAITGSETPRSCLHAVMEIEKTTPMDWEDVTMNVGIHDRVSKDAIQKDRPAFRLRLWGLPLFTLILSLGGCFADDVDPAKIDGTFTISGDIQGLSDEGVTLELNGQETLEVNEDGAFAFRTELGGSERYEVTVADHPGADQVCDISDGSGHASDMEADNVRVACSELRLGAASEIDQVSMDWKRDDSVDLIYSSDPNCDWENYSLCPDADLIPGETAGEFVLDGDVLQLSEDDGFYHGQPVFMAMAAEGQYSEPVSATALREGLAGEIEDFAFTNDRVYVAGDLEGYGTPVSNIAFVRDDTEEASLTGPLLSVDDRVNVVAEDGQGGWFVGGDFSRINGADHEYLARLDAKGEVDESWGFGVDDEVHDLKLDGDHLILAGDFEEIGDLNGSPCTERPYLARVHVGNAEADCEFGPVPDDEVHRVIAHQDYLVIGGEFDELGGDDRFESFGLLDREDGNVALDDRGAPVLDARFDDDVLALEVYGGVIYAGGEFRDVSVPDFQKVERNYAAALCLDEEPEQDIRCVNGLSTWNPHVDDYVYDIVAGDEHVFIGGMFDEVANTDREYVAAVDPATGAPAEDWRVEFEDDVYALHLRDEWLYAGGVFEGTEDVDMPGLARIDAAVGALDETWEGTLGTVDSPGEVRHLSATGQGMAAAGDFRVYDGDNLGGVAALDRDDGSLDRDWIGPEDTTVPDANSLDVSIITDAVFVGGRFDSVGALERKGAAAFDLDNGELLSWNPDLAWDGTGWLSVDQIRVHDGHVYLAGQFDEAGGQDRNHLVRVDRSRSGGGVDGTGDPDISRDSTIAPTVRALDTGTLDGDDVVLVGGFSIDEMRGEEQEMGAYAADDFTDLKAWSTDQSANRGGLKLLANDLVCATRGFNMDCWDEQGDSLSTPSVDTGNVERIAGNDDILYLGGDFTELDDEDRFSGFAVLDDPGNSDYSLRDDAPRFDGEITAMGVDGNKLFIGGNFLLVDGTLLPRIVVFNKEDGKLNTIW